MIDARFYMSDMNTCMYNMYYQLILVIKVLMLRYIGYMSDESTYSRYHGYMSNESTYSRYHGYMSNESTYSRYQVYLSNKSTCS